MNTPPIVPMVYCTLAADLPPDPPPLPGSKVAVVELMGHVRIAGRLTQEEHFGVKMGRLDIPTADGGFVTRLFGGASVYSISFVEEAAARAVALREKSQPVFSWELPKQLPAARAAEDEDDHGEFYPG